MQTFVDHICKQIEAELTPHDLVSIISFCESLLEKHGIELVSRIESPAQDKPPPPAGLILGKRPSKEHAVVVARKLVRCGKPNCSKCPHGPYYYAVQRTVHSKTKWKYLGVSVTGASQ